MFPKLYNYIILGSACQAAALSDVQFYDLLFWLLDAIKIG